MAATVLAAAATAWWFGGPVGDAVTATVVLGLSVAAWNVLHLWFWTFRAQAREGRAALARLATAEERLRCAGDVYALLANELSAIVLKAELASRLALVDGERTRKEATEMRALAAAARPGCARPCTATAASACVSRRTRWYGYWATPVCGAP